MPGRHRRPQPHRTTARAAGALGVAAVGLPLVPGTAAAADLAPHEAVADPGADTSVPDTQAPSVPDTQAPSVPDTQAPSAPSPGDPAPATPDPVEAPDPTGGQGGTLQPDASAPDLPAPGAPTPQVPDRVEDRVPDEVYDGDGAAQSRGEAAVEEASRHQGKPYQWGGSGPVAFDCSGFTKYVYAELGVGLPHNSAAQYEAVQHVPRDDMRVGDLVFVYDENGIYHVGIYAGGNEMWAATKTGDVVRTQDIWTDQYVVGRP